MRRTTMAFMMVALAAACSRAYAADVSGKWVAEITGPTLLEPAYAHVELTRSGEELTGTWGTNALKGSAKGPTIFLAATDAEGNAAGAMTGVLSGEAVSGSGTLAGLGRRPGGFATANRPPVPVEMKFTLTREAAPPPKPREINYEPTTFQAYYFAGNKPGIHIFPGDIVHTWAPDSAGMDKNLKRVALGGNSNIGPCMSKARCPATRWLCT